MLPTTFLQKEQSFQFQENAPGIEIVNFNFRISISISGAKYKKREQKNSKSGA